MPYLVAHRGHEGKHVSWPRRSRQAADSWVFRPVEREVSPYRFVRAVKAFREEVTRVGEPVRLRGRRKTRGKWSNGAVVDGGVSQSRSPLRRPVRRHPARGGQVFLLDVSAWFFKRDQATLSVASVVDAKAFKAT